MRRLSRSSGLTLAMGWSPCSPSTGSGSPTRTVRQPASQFPLVHSYTGRGTDCSRCLYRGGRCASVPAGLRAPLPSIWKASRISCRSAAGPRRPPSAAERPDRHRPWPLRRRACNAGQHACALTTQHDGSSPARQTHGTGRSSIAAFRAPWWCSGCCAPGCNPRCR